jgi:hypothetical protein
MEQSDMMPEGVKLEPEETDIAREWLGELTHSFDKEYTCRNIRNVGCNVFYAVFVESV